MVSVDAPVLGFGVAELAAQFADQDRLLERAVHVQAKDLAKLRRGSQRPFIEPAHQDDACLRLMVLQDLQNLYAVFAGHLQIKQNHARVKSRQLTHDGLASHRRRGNEIQSTTGCCQVFAHTFFVVDYQKLVHMLIHDVWSSTSRMRSAKFCFL